MQEPSDMQRGSAFSDVDDDGTILDPARVFVHLRRIDDQATVIATGPTHEPLPEHAVDAVQEHAHHVEPDRDGNEVADKAMARAREHALVG